MTAKKLFDMQFLLRVAAINQEFRFGPIVRVRRSDAPAQGLLSRNQARSPGVTGKWVIELEMSGGSASKKTGNRTKCVRKAGYAYWAKILERKSEALFATGNVLRSLLFLSPTTFVRFCETRFRNNGEPLRALWVAVISIAAGAPKQFCV